MSSKHADWAALVFGFSTLLLAAVLLSILPSKAELSDGFSTPIIAFEFAKTEKDLEFLSGHSVESQANRARMDSAHQWDMVFPFAYGGFLFFLLLGLVSRGSRVAWIGLPFALLAIPFDILENLTLLNITEALGNSASIAGYLETLYWRTWLKWGAIGMGILCIALGMLGKKEFTSGILGVAVASSVGICWLSGSMPVLTELMSLSISVFFVWCFIKTVIHIRRRQPEIV